MEVISVGIGIIVQMLFFILLNHQLNSEGYKRENIFHILFHGVIAYLFIFLLSSSFFVAIQESIFLTSLFMLSKIDIKNKEVPNRISLILLITGTIFVIIDGNFLSIPIAIGVFVFLLIPVFIFGGGLGGGDIKLYPICILFLDPNIQNALAYMMYSMLLNALYCLMIARLFFFMKKESRNIDFKTEIPHVPFMYGSAFILLLLKHI